MPFDCNGIKFYRPDGEITNSNTVDGYRLSLSNGDLIHLRPSGNAPELRCYSEAESVEKSEGFSYTSICCH